MRAEYVDVAAILSGAYKRPEPTRGGKRSDGLHLFYPGAVNGLVGDPEQGKTLIATACAADELFQGGSVLWVDLDHNGPGATVTRFREYGVGEEVLADPRRFRLSVPEDRDGMLAIVADATAWRPTLSTVDSVGELLPMFGASSNSADDYTAVNQQTLVKLARCGSAVVGLDHMAKGVESRAFGAGGTVAKKRAVDGAYLRVTSEGGFSRGVGGRADLSIIKDRHGALREASPAGKEPRVAVFEMENREGATNWRFTVPSAASLPDFGPSDVERLLALDPVPTSVRGVREALRCSKDRAEVAARAVKLALTVPHVPTVPGTSLGDPGTVSLRPSPRRGGTGDAPHLHAVGS